ncbi:unnamed protein product [Sphenostylis stenocarpa]|uniref:Uncharacterized protein n=1 Tax=Sphenostylis stenocarpa TaxID=92480 RepID=A0AA86W3H2_9FABA|nr:unnamed protein product [Sphenostylis stenocarpa]
MKCKQNWRHKREAEKELREERMEREWKSGERVPALTRGLRKRSNCRERKRMEEGENKR